MTEELNPKTLDLVGVLSGRDYPETTIEVYFNEALGFAIYELQKMLRSVEVLGSAEEIQDLQDKIRALVEDSEGQKYTILLKSIPESVRRGIIAKVSAKYPMKTDLLGRPEPSPESDEEFTRQIWRAYLRTITGPDGSSKVIDDKDVEALLDGAPVTVHEQISGAIEELQTGAKSGFEFAAKEIDFLSQASPEG